MSKILLVTLVNNRKHLVGEALQSAVNQTLNKDKWLHLVIDNNSTDGADKVCEVFSKKYNHMHFVRMSTNLHQMPAYNWALKWVEENYPEADIMVHLDSDDVLLSNALEEVYKIFVEHPEIGATYSGFNIISKSGRKTYRNHPKARQVNNQFSKEGQRELRKLFVSANPCGHLRAMRIKCLKDIGGFDESQRFATDFNMSGRMMERYPVVKIPKVLYNWRQHDVQVERQHSPEQTQNWMELKAHYRERWEKMGLI